MTARAKTFDQAFRQVKKQLAIRTEQVPVPEFEPFRSFFPADVFPYNEPVTMTVRQLTGNEYALVEEERQRAGNLDLVIEKAGKISSEQAEKIAQALGLYKIDEVPANSAWRIECMRILFPDLSREIVLQLNELFPMVVFRLTETAYKLTGMGAVYAEKKRVSCIETSGCKT